MTLKDIPKFISFFKDQINLAEMKYPLDHFKTFNEFFTRELKPGAGSIACMDRDDVAVCAADCRLTAFRTVRESTRFWLKEICSSICLSLCSLKELWSINGLALSSLPKAFCGIICLGRSVPASKLVTGSHFTCSKFHLHSLGPVVLFYPRVGGSE